MLRGNVRGGLNLLGNSAEEPEYLNLIGHYCVNYGTCHIIHDIGINTSLLSRLQTELNN